MADDLVSRDSELAVIAAALEGAGAGRGGLILVEGPAGCGKSALLRATLSRSNGWRTCRAAGGEFERTAAFGVVRELFAGVVARCGLPSGAAALAAPLFGLQAVDVSADAATLRHGLYWLVADLAGYGPLVLVVDDLQWADEESVRFVGYLAARLEGLSVVLVAGWRPGEPDVDDTVLDRLSVLATATMLHPGPLDHRATLVLLSRAMGEQATAELAGQLHEASGGNPFLLAELIGALRRSGSDGLPATPQRVKRALRARLDRLPTAARALADAAAVLGPGAPLGCAAALADLRSEQSAGALDALVAADVLRAERPLDFVHPLVRRAVRDALPPGRRAVAHKRAAQLLAESAADAEQVGGHLLQIDPAADEWTVQALLRALRCALQRGGPMAAIEYGRRALAEPPPGDLRAAALEALGDAEARVSEPRALERFEEARALIDEPDRRLELAVKRAHAAINSERLGRAELAQLSTALTDDGDRDPATAAIGHAVLLGGTINILDGAHVSAAARADTMRKNLPPGMPRRILAAFLVFHGLIVGGSSSRLRELALEAVGDDADARQNLAAGWQLTMTTNALATAGEPELALRRHNEALASARASRGPVAIFGCLVAGARIRALAGDLPTAEAEAIEALGLLDNVRSPMRTLFAARAVADALADRDPQRALDLLATVGLVSEVPNLGFGPSLLVARARLKLAVRDPTGAIADCKAAAAVAASNGFDSPGQAPAAEVAAEALLAAGRREDAIDAAADALVAAERFGAPAPIARARRVTALTQPAADRVEALRAAIAALAACGQPLAHAHGLLDLGSELRRARRRSDSREPLAAARELAHRHGALHLAERAHFELRAAGAHPRRIARSGVDALTPAELRVAQMAAEQRRNRAIGELLFVTEKTVETHLRNAYRKLDITSRDQLAAALMRDP